MQSGSVNLKVRGRQRGRASGEEDPGSRFSVWMMSDGGEQQPAHPFWPRLTTFRLLS